MYSNKKRKLTRITSGFTLFLIILNLFISFNYATEWVSIPDTRLTWGDSQDIAPSITQAQDGRIWIVWHSFEFDATNLEIFYKIYNESATFQWSPANKLTTNSSTDKTPSIATAGNDIWVVWSSNRDGNDEIYYKIYNGTFWTPDTRLTTNSSVDEFPSIMQDNTGDIWVVWSSNRDGNDEIYYKIYNGTSWTPDIRLITNPNSDWDPSITQAQDGKIWVAWVRDEDIYYKVLQATRIGEDIQIDEVVPDTNLTKPDETIDWHPSIMQTQDGEIRIAWDSWILDRDIDIYCTIYNGFFWSPAPERITYMDEDDVMPAIMQTSDEVIWVAWASSRLGFFDIYYKTNPPVQDLHDIAIISVTHNPNVTVAPQGLDINIEVVPQNYGLEGEIVQVTSYANSTLIGFQTVYLSAGQLMLINFAWDTATINPGNYVINAEASIVPGENDTADNSYIDGVVTISLPGDIDGDGIVNVFDLSALGKAYGSTPSTPNWNPEADINSDGAINIFDIGIMSSNWGQSW